MGDAKVTRPLRGGWRMKGARMMVQEEGGWREDGGRMEGGWRMEDGEERGETKREENQNERERREREREREKRVRVPAEPSDEPATTPKGQDKKPSKQTDRRHPTRQRCRIWTRQHIGAQHSIGARCSASARARAGWGADGLLRSERLLPSSDVDVLPAGDDHNAPAPVSYTHLRAHETEADL
eukprot:715180-Rhodomonas_salina.2